MVRGAGGRGSVAVGGGGFGAEIKKNRPTPLFLMAPTDYLNQNVET